MCEFLKRIRDTGVFPFRTIHDEHTLLHVVCSACMCKRALPPTDEEEGERGSSVCSVIAATNKKKTFSWQLN